MGMRRPHPCAKLGWPPSGPGDDPATGSTGVVTAQQIEERPVFRSGEVYEAVPGVVVSQHSGEGKANQYYVRGFNIDHGTDLATLGGGRAGQHADARARPGLLRQQLPDPGAGLRRAVPEGDLLRRGGRLLGGRRRQRELPERPRPPASSRSRAARTASAARSSRGVLEARGGPPARRGRGPPQRRPLGARPTTTASGTASCASARATSRTASASPAMAYSGRWNSTDQVPGARHRRAGSSTASARSIPPTAGSTHRYTLAGEWRKSTGAGLTLVKAYAIDYGLDLFSNFTYFLDDPVHGDQFEQKDERGIFGGSVSQRFLSRWFGKDAESVGGLPGALRPHPDARPLPHRGARAARHDPPGPRRPVERRALLPDQHPVDAQAARRSRACAATSTTST